MTKQLETENFKITDFGLIDYSKAYDIQKQMLADVIGGAVDSLILCQHPTVLTLGRLASLENILAQEEDLKSRGIDVVSIDRGGEVTIHMPGQLIAYPIFNLRHAGKDLRVYLEKLEQVAIDLLLDFGILAKRVSGRRGVWVDSKKIASIGIGVKKWVSYHGLSVNVNPDMNLFSLIKPCGLDVRMSSIEECLNKPISTDLVKEALISKFQKNFTF